MKNLLEIGKSIYPELIWVQEENCIGVHKKTKEYIYSMKIDPIEETGFKDPEKYLRHYVNQFLKQT